MQTLKNFRFDALFIERDTPTLNVTRVNRLERSRRLKGKIQN